MLAICPTKKIDMFIRVYSRGFLDVHGVLSTRKGSKVVKSSSSAWLGFSCPFFYCLV